MTHEQQMQLIQSYINDIKDYTVKPNLTANEKQHLKRALDTYTTLYSEVERGKFSADELHESITGFLYVIQ